MGCVWQYGPMANYGYDIDEKKISHIDLSIKIRYCQSVLGVGIEEKISCISERFVLKNRKRKIINNFLFKFLRVLTNTLSCKKKKFSSA